MVGSPHHILSSFRPVKSATVGCASPLDDLPALITRTNIHFQALVERMLRELRLDGLLQPGMAPVLFALYEQDGCIIKELAARTQRSASALNSLLGRLKKSGLVTMSPCPQDGRAVRVRLTALGLEIEPRVRELHHRVLAAVEHGLAPDEAVQVSGILLRIITALQQDDALQHSFLTGHPNHRRTHS
ncbi:MarR family winged helix-turn-helix transcriptional regulator [Prosthecobacter fluviatilis]|uniref:MarR family winged helix-turn-helix transcriptional regulator n=1 Tax=Prosthecobacter fluviatilis TaxID=445931 RepID=A0ABW0KQG0_9BACT